MRDSDIRPGGTSAALPMDGQVLGGGHVVVRFLNLVKFPHTVFALPFALVGVVAAARVAPVTPRLVVLVVVAFTAARWAALAFNMIADRRFDALNPRNARRELPRGVLTVGQAWASVVVSGAIFLGAASAINGLTRLLAPVALGWVLLYSLTKRFTSFTQVWLGLSLAIAPVGAYLAITGAWSRPWWVLCAIGTGITCWVAAFDLFHALPDLEFDRAHGLRSLVTLLGRTGAQRLAAALHAVAVPMFVLFGVGAGFGAAFMAAVGIAGGLLAAQHVLLARRGMAAMPAVFFQLNALLSATVFAGALLDFLLTRP
jgi:4-hydroxybenzoate polyprenyltransferase